MLNNKLPLEKTPVNSTIAEAFAYLSRVEEKTGAPIIGSFVVFQDDCITPKTSTSDTDFILSVNSFNHNYVNTSIDSNMELVNYLLDLVENAKKIEEEQTAKVMLLSQALGVLSELVSDDLAARGRPIIKTGPVPDTDRPEMLYVRGKDRY